MLNISCCAQSLRVRIWTSTSADILAALTTIGQFERSIPTLTVGRNVPRRQPPPATAISGERIVEQIDRLNPYDRNVVAEPILQIEKVNFEPNGELIERIWNRIQAIFARYQDGDGKFKFAKRAHTGWGSSTLPRPTMTLMPMPLSGYGSMGMRKSRRNASLVQSASDDAFHPFDFILSPVSRRRCPLDSSNGTSPR